MPRFTCPLRSYTSHTQGRKAALSELSFLCGMTAIFSDSSYFPASVGRTQHPVSPQAVRPYYCQSCWVSRIVRALLPPALCLLPGCLGREGEQER